MMEKRKVRRLIKEEPWVLKILQERKAVFPRPVRKRALNIGVGVTEKMRSPEVQATVAAQVLLRSISTFLLSTLESSLAPVVREAVSKRLGV